MFGVKVMAVRGWFVVHLRQGSWYVLQVDPQMSVEMIKSKDFVYHIKTFGHFIQSVIVRC